VVILRYFDTQCDSLGFFLGRNGTPFTNYDCISACLLALRLDVQFSPRQRLERMSYGPDLHPEASIKGVFSSKSIPSQQVLKY
jgi:hypothetical protein